MFGPKKKRGPTQAFTHTPDCKIMRADPTTQIPWQEIETNYWVAECVCGKEYWRELPTDRRVRLDPRDPARSRHAGACEHAATTDPTILRAILKVSEREGYWWVECNVCDCGWQVLYYAASNAG